jgi:FAD/FMN-containing dehydrogenase
VERNHRGRGAGREGRRGLGHNSSVLVSEDVDVTSSTWAGDGNFHVIIVFDPQDAEELGRVKEANDQIVNQAIDAGGHVHR